MNNLLCATQELNRVIHTVEVWRRGAWIARMPQVLIDQHVLILGIDRYLRVCASVSEEAFTLDRPPRRFRAFPVIIDLTDREACYVTVPYINGVIADTDELREEFRKTFLGSRRNYYS